MAKAKFLSKDLTGHGDECLELKKVAAVAAVLRQDSAA